MPGKRKRGNDASLTAATDSSHLSAIAAARLKAGAPTKGVPTPEPTHEKVSVPSSPTPEVVAYGSGLPYSVEEGEDGDSEEDSQPNVKCKVKFCNWRNDSKDILCDTGSELTVNLSKHTTIALVGSFKFKVLRGAININGANIAAASRAAQDDRFHHAFMPAIHPILKFRGLDSTNHVQFMSWNDPIPLASNKPPFAHISIAPFVTRSFSVVS